MQKQNKKIERGNNESNTIYERPQRVCNVYVPCRYLYDRGISRDDYRASEVGQPMKLSQQLFHEATALFWTDGDEDEIYLLVRRAITERGYEELYADNADSEDED